MVSPSLHKNLLTTLREKLIPAAQAGAPLELLEPPLRGAAGVVTSQRARPLPEPRAEPSHLHLRTWPDEGLNALRVPYLGFVFEGEADIKTGITTSMARAASNHEAGRGPRAFDECGRQVLALRVGAFFIVAPGVPLSCGPRPHWERAHPEQAHSRLFWIHALPSGAMCHTCISESGRHRTHPSLFVREPQLALTAELLLRELRRRETGAEAIAREAAIAGAQLLVLLLQLERAFATQEPLLLDTPRRIEHAASLPSLSTSMMAGAAKPLATPPAETTVQRACSYIQANLNQPLTPDAIAAHAYVSTAHLNRLFHAERGAPLMQTVTRCRHDYAKSLLAKTALSIAEVGQFVGYRHASHFSQVFSRLEGIAPQEYRRRTATEATPKSKPAG